MTKSITTPAKLVTLSVPTFNFSVFKSEIFKDITALELLTVLNKMQEDLLCSTLTNDDCAYRNEIVVASRVLTQMIIGIHKEIHPSSIHVMELILEKNA